MDLSCFFPSERRSAIVYVFPAEKWSDVVYVLFRLREGAQFSQNCSAENVREVFFSFQKFIRAPPSKAPQVSLKSEKNNKKQKFLASIQTRNTKLISKYFNLQNILDMTEGDYRFLKTYLKSELFLGTEILNR